MSSFKLLKSLKNQSGNALIEFAILLPVFLILTFAVISFGYAYVIYEAEGRMVTTAAQAISAATPPSDPTNWSPITWSEAAAFGNPLIVFPAPNPKTGPAPGQPSICAQSYATLNEAQTALNTTKPCDKDVWDAKPPTTGWTVGNPWYVLVQAKVIPPLPIPDLYTWMATLLLKQASIATVAGTAATASGSSSAWVTVPAHYNLSNPDVYCQNKGYKAATGSCYIDDFPAPGQTPEWIETVRYYGSLYYPPPYMGITGCYAMAPDYYYPSKQVSSNTSDPALGLTNIAYHIICSPGAPVNTSR